MLHLELLHLRATCAGGGRDGIRKANSALKTMRYVSTDDSDAGSCAETVIDLTALVDVPITPWEYTDEKGPSGQWSGIVTTWNWRHFMASIPADQYEEMFQEQYIVKFVCRACPFQSPYPATHKLPHWELTATRADGVCVGMHPPGKKGAVQWVIATDEDRAAALAAVHKKGVSAKVRACYDAPPPTKARPPTHLQYLQPTTLQGGRAYCSAALAALESQEPLPPTIPKYFEAFAKLSQDRSQVPSPKQAATAAAASTSPASVPILPTPTPPAPPPRPSPQGPPLAQPKPAPQTPPMPAVTVASVKQPPPTADPLRPNRVAPAGRSTTDASATIATIATSTGAVRRSTCASTSSRCARPTYHGEPPAGTKCCAGGTTAARVPVWGRVRSGCCAGGTRTGWPGYYTTANDPRV